MITLVIRDLFFSSSFSITCAIDRRWIIVRPRQIFYLSSRSVC